MTLKNSRLAPKITELFDSLEASMSSGDYEHADVVLARLSKYFHIFDDEHTDYYQYAQHEVELCLHGLDAGDDSGLTEYVFSDDDEPLFDWDGDALASAGFGTDEDYQ